MQLKDTFFFFFIVELFMQFELLCIILVIYIEESSTESAKFDHDYQECLPYRRKATEVLQLAKERTYINR